MPDLTESLGGYKLKQIAEVVKKVVSKGQFPFVLLANRIEHFEKCRINFRETSASALPAYCISHREHFHLAGEDEVVYLVPHHLIMVHRDCLRSPDNPAESPKFTAIQGRVCVAHELGHIMLHFPEFKKDFLKGRLPAGRVTPGGAIDYTNDEEIEATLFAGLLCLLHGIPQWRSLPTFDSIDDQLYSTFDSLFPDKSFKDDVRTAFQSLRDVVRADLPPYDQVDDIFHGQSDETISQARTELDSLQRKTRDFHVADTETALKRLLQQSGVPEGGSHYQHLDDLMGSIRHRMEHLGEFVFGQKRSPVSPNDH